ncbi:Putative DMSO reductase anchor subunit (DmsC) [Herminiimonas arsenicoxydans]|uniref:DMSO reductase anchor subunit (DmsC) n=1 Tax=Herminiimonas arsenicoxydans TaxID=204773 RepID=A4GAB1_HERAR|nr:Putative DMSO reductase anchor subunit (DmsC) [Herminiimonas arsenicoxydans]
MNPAFSVIFLTTLIGVGQGLFIALYAAHLLALLGLIAPSDSYQFHTLGSALSLAFLGCGLFASFFHLGHPERAWRAATMWRTSWLSREVIALPFFMLAVFAYGAAHFFGWQSAATIIGGIALILCITLFVCTGMIYGCIKFLQEWATPLTIVNYTLLGCASGFTLATAFSLPTAPALVTIFGVTAIVLTLASLMTRLASLARNARLKPRSTLQTATGIRHPHILQKAQGAMGGSFNTRHYFHGKSPLFFRSIKWIFLLLVFPLPLLLLGNGLLHASLLLLGTAFVVQYAGLIAERWFFFAQANHPQNLYYQQIS